MRRRWIPAGILCLTAALAFASQLGAYPGGTPRVVTNATPFCTNCHSSTSADQLREMPADAIPGMLIENRHYSEITAGEEGYSKLSADDRQKLLTAVKAVDANSHVELSASATSLKPLAPFTVTVKTRGGGGPVIGVMLTDTDMRFQSSPIQAEGFAITKAPDVTGADGKPQTKFLDGRLPGLSKGINYVNIQDVKSDPAAGTYPECKVVYALRAPADPGEYTMSAAFLYGT
jgi:hypothetical protein